MRALLETRLLELIESFQDPNDPDSGMPVFVENEFLSARDCGNPRHGFIRLFCDRCQHEHPLPLSCKARAICASCGARRMEELTSHLVDHVLPEVPIRQYVLSPPFELVGLLACRTEVLAKLVQIFVRTLARAMKTWARSQGLGDAQCGSVVAIQRFTKTLSVSPHLHVLWLDGVFVKDHEAEAPRFVPAPPPKLHDLLKITREVYEKVTRFLRKAGYLGDEDRQETPLDRWYLRSFREPALRSPTRLVLESTGVEYGGFSLHAGVTVAKDDKVGREQLCRYVTRPPFAEDQLRGLPDGRVQLTLRRPARNGQRTILLEPLQFLRRLAWLVPPPRRHQLIYTGILAPRAKWRPQIVLRPPQIQLAFPCENLRPQRRSFRPSWAQLIARVYDLDSQRCPVCGGPLRIIGAVTSPDQARAHLARLGTVATRARDPPQLRLAF